MDRSFKGIWVPKEIWLDKSLSFIEKFLIVEIDSLDNEEGCFATNSYFAEFFGKSYSTMSRTINKLNAKGWISVEYQYEGKEIKKRILRVNKPPYPYFDLLQKCKGGIAEMQGGYCKNGEGNSINNNKLIYTTLSDTENKDLKTTTPLTGKNNKTKFNYQALFDYYLTLNLKKHRNLTDSMVKGINKAIKEYGNDIEHFKRMLDRHIIDIKNTRNDGEYAVRPRELNVFFGQKKSNSVVLICNKYADDVWEDVKSNTSRGDVDIG